MSYATVKAGFAAVFATVTTPRALATVLGHEPTSTQDAPLIYSQLEDFTDEVMGTIIWRTWRTLHRLLVRWQDNAAAEDELNAFADSIPAAVIADPTLGGRVRRAMIVQGEADWVSVAGTEYRSLDFHSEAIEIIGQMR